jgi:predicted CXXCH cytochrome family protein
MRKRLSSLLAAAFFLFPFSSPAQSHPQPSSLAREPHRWTSRFAQYTQIPGATRVGSETCKACHSDVASNFQHAYHAQQGVECEDCHGPGSLHAQSADITKIISFSHRTAAEANGVCLGCHVQEQSVRNWMAGPHAGNGVRCTDCHQVHSTAPSPNAAMRLNFEAAATGHGATRVEDIVPESKVMFQARAEANDACLRCHQAERAQMSLPYHHPLREGKMSCVDCHDPHGGPTGNNLRAATVNQLCLQCHTQYRGPFAYQHPPVTESCVNCHVAHGSPNTNLLTVSEPALCLQCHAGHHNGAGLPLTDRCTDCHVSIHGTDVPTPSGGSRFVDKGPSEEQLRTGNTAPLVATVANQQRLAALTHGSVPAMPALSLHAAPILSAGASAPFGSAFLADMSGGFQAVSAEAPASDTTAMFSVTPAEHRFVDVTGFGGRVGEFDSLENAEGGDVEEAYVSKSRQLTILSRANVLTGDDYHSVSQVTLGDRLQAGFDVRSLVQQQDHYPFYAFPVLDIPPGSTTPPDSTTDLIPSGTVFGVVRRIGNAYGRVKLPKIPVHVFVNGNWQARAGTTQLAYLDENTTPAVYVNGANTTCGAQCHYNSQFQPVNYTTRGVSGGGEVDWHSLDLIAEHTYSSFNDRLPFPTATFTGPFTPENEGISTANPPVCPAAVPNCNPGPAPMDVAAGNYYIDIPPPSTMSSDRVNLNWTPSARISFNGNANYSRLRDTYTNYPQNVFNSDETLNWNPVDRLRITADYHQANTINNFTPYYTLYGNVSYHDHWEGARAEYELPHGFDVEAYYRRSGITRSNSAFWPQLYSIDNTDLSYVVPSSTSNTTGLAGRYHDRGFWSARAGYEWTGTHDPGYLIVPENNNRVFGDVTLTPVHWLVFANDISIIIQNGSPAIPLLRADGTGDVGNFQRRNRFYFETATATLPILPAWNVAIGYSYQQNDLTTYVAFQNDPSVGYVIDEPAVPYKQITQAYWGESRYSLKQRLGVNLRITYNSARSGYRPDLNPNDAATLGNQTLISSGTFDPIMFAAALSNLQFSSTQISQVIVPQWIGQSKAYYLFPRKFEGGLVFYYGSYKDYLNPNLNGVLRTFSIYVGRTW